LKPLRNASSTKSPSIPFLMAVGMVRDAYESLAACRDAFLFCRNIKLKLSKSGYGAHNGLQMSISPKTEPGFAQV